MKRARVIYNPTAGREEARKYMAQILEHLEGAGYETSTHATRGAGDATREAARIAEQRYDLVVAAGGDGTIYEVINGLAEKPFRPALGILPMGTSNDFARAIGIPRSINKALSILTKGKLEWIDIGKMNQRYFINIAGGGALTELTYEVPIKLKTILGQLAYYIKGVEKLPRLRPYSMVIKANNQVIEEEVLIFLVANSNSVGGFDKLAPHAELNDGLFDVLILKKSNLGDLVRVMTQLLRGEHINDPKVIHFQTDRLTVQASEDVLINLDGELGGTAPSEFRVLKKHLPIIVNPKYF